MPLIQCPECHKEISDSAISCPHCGKPLQTVSAPPPPKKKTSPLAWGCLIVLIIGFVGICSSLNETSKRVSSVSHTPSTPVQTEPQLELVTFSWHEEYDYAILEGQVKNISGASLSNVEAVATFYDAKGGFITSSDALIDYNPILAGQTSPFKVMTTWNPAMKKAGVEFKTLMGGTLRTRQQPKK